MELGLTNRPDPEALNSGESEKKCHVQRRRRLEEGWKRRTSEPSEDNLLKANGECAVTLGEKIDGGKTAGPAFDLHQTDEQERLAQTPTRNETSGPGQSSTLPVLMPVWFVLYGTIWSSRTTMGWPGLRMGASKQSRAEQASNGHTHTRKQRTQ